MSYSPAAQQSGQLKETLAPMREAKDKRGKQLARRAQERNQQQQHQQQQQQQQQQARTIEQFRAARELADSDYLYQSQLSSCSSTTTSATVAAAETSVDQVLLLEKRPRRQQIVHVPAQTHAMPQASSVLLVAPKSRKSRSHPMGTVSGVLSSASREQQHQQQQQHQLQQQHQQQRLAQQQGQMEAADRELCRGEENMGGPLQLVKSQAPYDSHDQVLLIVNDDHKQGGGVPIIGRRLPSKSARARDQQLLHEQHLLEHRMHGQPEQAQGGAQMPLAARGAQGQVLGRRSHRLLLQGHQLRRLQQPLGLEMPASPGEPALLPAGQQGGRAARIRQRDFGQTSGDRLMMVRENPVDGVLRLGPPPARGSLDCCPPGCPDGPCPTDRCCRLALEAPARAAVLGRQDTWSSSLELDDQQACAARRLRRQKRRPQAAPGRPQHSPITSSRGPDFDQQTPVKLVGVSASYGSLVSAGLEQPAEVGEQQRLVGRPRSCHPAGRSSEAALWRVGHSHGQAPLAPPPIPEKPRSFQMVAAGSSPSRGALHLRQRDRRAACSPADDKQTAVSQMYESLAAELKAKLGDPRAAPILLPPKDYDTLSRRQGQLTGIELRRSTNPQLVGPGGLLAKQQQQQQQKPHCQLSSSAAGQSPTRSSISSSSSSSGCGPDQSSAGSLASATGRAGQPRGHPLAQAEQDDDEEEEEEEEAENRQRSLSNSSSGLGSIMLGTASSPSAVSSNDDLDGSEEKQAPEVQSKVAAPQAHENQEAEQLARPSCKRQQQQQQETQRGKGIENHNPAKVSDGILWNGRVEIPLKINSERNNGGQTYLATRQIIY